MKYFLVWLCLSLICVVNSRLNIHNTVYRFGSSVSWLKIRGGEQIDNGNGKMETSTVMLRIQFPNGKVEKLEFSSDDSISTLAIKVKSYFKSNRSYFKSYKLLDLSLVLQGKSQSLEDLLQNNDTIGSKNFKFGDWITFQLPANSNPPNKRSGGGGKVHTLSDIEKYKESLFKFTRKRTKQERLPKILFPSHLLSLTQNIYRKGGIQLLFGKYINQTSLPGQYHIVGSYDLFSGNLLEPETTASWLIDNSTITRLQSLKSTLQACNCQILGLTVCTHTEESNQTLLTDHFHSWNPIMFYVSTIISKIVDQKDFLVISVLKKMDIMKNKNKNKSEKGKKLNPLQQNTSEPFVLEGYRLINQTYTMIDQQIINTSHSFIVSYLQNYSQIITNPKSKLKAIQKNKKHGDNNNHDIEEAFTMIPLSQKILLGYDDVDNIDVSLLSQPLPIVSIDSSSSLLIPFRSFFPTLSEIQDKKSHLSGRAFDKFQKQLQSFIRNVFTKLIKGKTLDAWSDCLVELRDLSLIEYLSTILPKGLWRNLVSSFIAYDQRELEYVSLLHAQTTEEDEKGEEDRRRKLAKTKVGHEKAKQKGLESPLTEKKLSKRIQMELSLFLDTLPQERIRYQGASRRVDELEEEL